MKNRLDCAYARRGKRPWCRQTLLALDSALVRAAERYFASRSVDSLVRRVGGKQAKEWIRSRPRNFRGKQADRNAPHAFDQAVGMLRRAYANGKRLPHARERWLGYAFLKKFERGTAATAHWLNRTGRLRIALEAAGPEVLAAWFFKPRGTDQPRALEWLREDPRVRAAERELKRLGLPPSFLSGKRTQSAPSRVHTHPVPPRPSFGSIGGKRRGVQAPEPAASEWEEEEIQGRGPIAMTDEALEALEASSAEEPLTRLIR